MGLFSIKTACIMRKKTYPSLLWEIRTVPTLPTLNATKMVGQVAVLTTTPVTMSAVKEDSHPSVTRKNALMGSSYCTYAPEYECYVMNGHPLCCAASPDSCLLPAKPTCEIELIVGDSYQYCTYPPDYDCHFGGQPVCCSTDPYHCPQDPPSCERV
eukprot:scaffold7518_cov150-Amphora_coffeaeformis.AAC.1